jgi:hypothetical protein
VADGEGNGGMLLKLLGAAVALVTLVGGGLGLLFQLRPGLRPCVGGASAAFTGAPVFPQSLHDYLFSQNDSRQDIARQPNLDGVEVRFSYRAQNLKNTHLRLYSSLVTVGSGGEVSGVVPEANRQLQLPIFPNTCTKTGGKDVFVPILDHGKRYRLVLELYRGAGETFDDRVALYETATFHG